MPWFNFSNLLNWPMVSDIRSDIKYKINIKLKFWSNKDIYLIYSVFHFIDLLKRKSISYVYIGNKSGTISYKTMALKNWKNRSKIGLKPWVNIKSLKYMTFKGLYKKSYFLFTILFSVLLGVLKNCSYFDIYIIGLWAKSSF